MVDRAVWGDAAKLLAVYASPDPYRESVQNPINLDLDDDRRGGLGATRYVDIDPGGPMGTRLD